MTSRTFSNWMVLKSALKRFKWFGILYGIALLLELPLLLWMDLSRQQAFQGASWIANEGFRAQMIFHPVAHFTNMAVAVIFGLIIFNYLHQERANIFFHSLPIKRSILYLQNMLAGVLLIWVPLLINGLIIRLVLSRFGITEGQWFVPEVYGPMGQLISGGATAIGVWQLLGYWALLNMLMTGLFLVFTVFIGMLTGNVLLQGSLTLIGLFLPLGLYMLVKFNLMKLLYGFPSHVNDRFVEWLSPVVSYLNDSNFRFMSDQVSWYAIYFLLLILLVAASLYLYKLRHAEAAGETLASDWMRWIFKYGVAACFAMTGGLYFNAMNESMPALYLGYAVGGLLGYIISDMIAHKSFHFYKRWKGILVFALAFVLLISSINLDLVGYEKFIPTQEKVQAVYLGNLAGDPYNPVQPGEPQKGLSSKENIERVRQLHKDIIAKQAENEAARNGNYRVAIDKIPDPEDITRVIPLEITYTLKNGELVKRTYTIDIFKYSKNLAAIFNTEEARRSMYSQFFQLETGKLDQININNHRFGKNIRIYKKEEVKEAMAALEKDVLNISYEAAVEGKRPAKGQIEFVMKEEANRNHKPIYPLSYYMGFSNFDKFLKEYGYFDELFLNPADISKITIYKTGSSDTAEVTNKEDIELLLNWCHREDEKAIKMRQNEVKEWVQYFGKIVKEDGSTIFVGFEGSPYVLQYLQTFFE